MTEVKDTVGAAVAAFVDQDLASEQTRKASIEAKGVALITSTGALVTAILAITKFGGIESTALLIGSPSRWLMAAGAAFVLAAIGGIAVNIPARYAQLDPDGLVQIITSPDWTDEGSEARRQLTYARTLELASWRRLNQLKARVIVAGLLVQVTGVIFMIATIVAIVGKP